MGKEDGEEEAIGQEAAAAAMTEGRRCRCVWKGREKEAPRAEKGYEGEKA